MMKAWCLALALVAVPGLASAQNRGFALEGGGGYTGFADDGIVGHTLVAAAARIYLMPRVSVGPEFQFMAGENDHRDLMLTGNVYVDLSERAPGRPVVPYLVVGGGLFQTRDEFNGETFTSSEGGFTAGGGVRIFLGNNFYVGPEFRGGWEPHFRISVNVGYGHRH
jgi:hypothetical protein